MHADDGGVRGVPKISLYSQVTMDTSSTAPLAYLRQKIRRLDTETMKSKAAELCELGKEGVGQ